MAETPSTALANDRKQMRREQTTGIIRPSIFPIMAVALIVIVVFAGCGYGVVGKKTAAKLDNFTSTAGTTIGKSRDTIVDYLIKTREGILDYFRNNSTKEAHDLSLGLMQGVIGYLDSAQNRDNLAHFFDSIITHIAGPARIQLIQFKNELLDPTFTRQINTLLRGVMQELILHPADNLVSMALSDHTRMQLDKLLQMVIPAIINDSAITQLGKLREVLLGANLKKDIASWADTALIVLDSQLKTRLKPTIHDIVDDNTSTIRKDAGWIITGVGIAAIAIILTVYYVQRKKVKLNENMLHQVTVQIERMKQTHPENYEQLTSNIKQAMLEKDLEPDMSHFLEKKHIHVPSSTDIPLNK